jgi:hypothetical protein
MESEPAAEPLWVGRFTFAPAVKSNIILRVARVMQALPGGFVVALSAANEDEGPPVPRDLWARTWERAADCGLTHGAVARRLGISLPHLSNIEMNRRKSPRWLQPALEKFLVETTPTQGRLLIETSEPPQCET